MTACGGGEGGALSSLDRLKNPQAHHCEYNKSKEEAKQYSWSDPKAIDDVAQHLVARGHRAEWLKDDLSRGKRDRYLRKLTIGAVNGATLKVAHRERFSKYRPK